MQQQNYLRQIMQPVYAVTRVCVRWTRRSVYDDVGGINAPL